MKINEKKLSTILSLLENHLLKELKKDDFKEERTAILTEIRRQFIQEVFNLNKGKNIKKMYDKKYWERYKRTTNW